MSAKGNVVNEREKPRKVIGEFKKVPDMGYRKDPRLYVYIKYKHI